MFVARRVIFCRSKLFFCLREKLVIFTCHLREKLVACICQHYSPHEQHRTGQSSKKEGGGGTPPGRIPEPRTTAGSDAKAGSVGRRERSPTGGKHKNIYATRKFFMPHTGHSRGWREGKAVNNRRAKAHPERRGPNRPTGPTGKA